MVWGVFQDISASDLCAFSSPPVHVLPYVLYAVCCAVEFSVVADEFFSTSRYFRYPFFASVPSLMVRRNIHPWDLPSGLRIQCIYCSPCSFFESASPLHILQVSIIITRRRPVLSLPGWNIMDRGSALTGGLLYLISPDPALWHKPRWQSGPFLTGVGPSFVATLTTETKRVVLNAQVSQACLFWTVIPLLLHAQVSQLDVTFLIAITISHFALVAIVNSYGRCSDLFSLYFPLSRETTFTISFMFHPAV